MSCDITGNGMNEDWSIMIVLCVAMETIGTMDWLSTGGRFGSPSIGMGLPIIPVSATEEEEKQIRQKATCIDFKCFYFLFV